MNGWRQEESSTIYAMAFRAFKCNRKIYAKTKSQLMPSTLNKVQWKSRPDSGVVVYTPSGDPVS